jgi:leader peptidase (prepilin peptidase)/N-methyltransferase
MSGGEAALAVLAFGWGASWGSFANVVAWRLPRGASLVRPGSACPSCGSAVPVRGNVPVLGWALVRGRCRACRTPISLRYPLVELAVGLGALALWLRLVGPDAAHLTAGEAGLRVFVPFVLQTAFVAALVALTLIDLAWFLLPDRLTWPLLALGLAAAAASPLSPTLTESAVGAVVGGALPAAVMVLWLTLTGRDGLGGGDWKLLGAIGAWLGPESIPFVLGAGAIQGLVTALLFRRDFAVAELPALPGEAPPPPLGPSPGALADSEAPIERAPAGPTAAVDETSSPSFMRLAVPFGPFLALSALEWLLWGERLRAALPG